MWAPDQDSNSTFLYTPYIPDSGAVAFDPTCRPVGWLQIDGHPSHLHQCSLSVLYWGGNLCFWLFVSISCALLFTSWETAMQLLFQITPQICVLVSGVLFARIDNALWTPSGKLYCLFPCFCSCNCVWNEWVWFICNQLQLPAVGSNSSSLSDLLTSYRDNESCGVCFNRLGCW
jgi:hypothetical protein